ncbi:MAG: type IX secretion system sortase PorU, partial [Marinirhabdus sp.]
MKFVLLFCSFVLLCTPALAQNRTITLPWAATVTALKEQPALPNTAKTPKNALWLHFGDDHTEYTDQWPATGFAVESSLKVSNIKYGALTAKQKQQVQGRDIPTEFRAAVKSNTARDKIYTLLTATPFVKRNGTVQRVNSFSISYNETNERGGPGKFPLSSSVLAQGDFYKFEVDRTGIYKLDSGFLEALGLDTQTINPDNIKIYGDGGQSLPLLNDANTFFDVPENAVQVLGGEDGSFDPGDTVLFFARGPLGFVEENDSHINPYSSTSYYYITAAGGPGKRVSPMQEPTGTPNVTLNTFNDRKFHEEDTFSPSLLGRRWYGNAFDIENEQSFTFALPNKVTGSEVNIVVKASVVSEIPTSLSVTINGSNVDPLQFGTTSQSTPLSIRGNEYTIAAGPEELTVNLVFNNGGNPAARGFLDYIQINGVCQLVGGENQFTFRNNSATTLSGIGEYVMSGAENTAQIWDITDRGNVTAKLNAENAAQITFKAQLGEFREYVTVNPNDFYAPIRVERPKLLNQDLKGTIFKGPSGNFEDIDYLIVAPPFMLQPALRLANHHKNGSNLRVKVVTTDKIYNEFSTGKQDIAAIRNFVKYVYDNGSGDANRLKYLCLMGDASVDYKNRLPNNTNVVPIFHRLGGASSSSSFMSDDFFGYLDAGEGTVATSDRLDIAIGRMVCENVSQANTLVDKVVNYNTKASYGNWRNNFILVSDDVDEEYEYEELEVNLDRLGDEIAASKPFINVKKIHSDAFKQETSAGGNRYPEVTEAIKNNLEVGALILTYLGHGGEDGLAKEFIYTKGLAQNLQNKNRNACIVTVTCEFTKFDNPLRITAGELTYLNPNGGAIGLMTTTRSISVSGGVEFNDVVAPYLFGFETNFFPTPAEALRLAKNEISRSERRVVFYVGDPALGLAFPEQRIELTTINDVPVTQATDTLKALSRVKLGGRVTDPNGNLLTNYNGVLGAKIFDKFVERQTLGNDDVRDANGQLLILNFITLGEGLFNGQASVTNGEFSFEFVVPRDIQVPVGTGRVSLYAQKNGAL